MFYAFLIYSVPIISFMLLYLVFVFFKGTFFEHKIVNFYIEIAFIFSAFLYVIIASVRYESGSDWYPYLKYFQIASFDYYYEPLFKAFTVFIRKFGLDNFNVYLFLINLNYFFIVIFILKFVPNKFVGFISMYIFYWPYFMGGLRQSIAISLATASLFFYYSYSKKRFFWLFFSVLALMFHYSAIVIFLYPVFFKINLRKKTLNIVLLGAFALALLSSYLSLYLKNFLSLFYGVNPIISKLFVYTGTRLSDLFGRSIIIDYILILERIIYIYLYIKFKKSKFSYKNKILTELTKLSFWGSIIFISFVFINRTLSGRIIGYFRIGDIILLTNSYNGLILFRDKKINFLFINFLVVVYIMLRFYLVLYTTPYYHFYKSIM